MEIFQREWCNIYLWTINGSAIFHIPRDRQYWTACFEVLSEYWWAHLVPAKHAIANNRRADAYNYMCATLPASIEPKHSCHVTVGLRCAAILHLIPHCLRSDNIAASFRVSAQAAHRDCCCRPSPSHKLTAGLTTWSKAMAKAAPASIYPPSQHVLR